MGVGKALWLAGGRMFARPFLMGLGPNSCWRIAWACRAQPDPGADGSRSDTSVRREAMPGVLFAGVNRGIESGTRSASDGLGLGQRQVLAMEGGPVPRRRARRPAGRRSPAEIPGSTASTGPLANHWATDAVAPLGWGTIDVRRASRSNTESRRNRNTGLETLRRGAGTSRFELLFRRHDGLGLERAAP